MRTCLRKESRPKGLGQGNKMAAITSRENEEPLISKKRLDRASIVYKVKPKKVSGGRDLVATTLRPYRTREH